MCPALRMFPAARCHLHTMPCLALAQATHFNPDLLPYQDYIRPNICASPQEEEGEGRDKIFQGASILSWIKSLTKLLLQQNNNGVLL